MKYALIIPDGAADERLAALNGRTPLEAALTPNLDRLVGMGRLGTVRTTPDRFSAGSDVCSMSLIGYDPARYHTGRAPLEAAAMGITGSSSDVVCRVNLVTIDQQGVMRDHSAGGITGDEALGLFQTVAGVWTKAGVFDAASLTHGEGYRAALVDRSGRLYDGARTKPPHEMLDDPVAGHEPAGSDAADWLAELMRLAGPVLRDHPINRARMERGQRPATDVWIWGQGTFPSMPSFADRYGVRGVMTTSVDLLAGIAALIGWDRLDVPGLTGWHDTDYEAQGQACVDALDRWDMVCCHVETPDEAAHQADWRTKTESIESIDHWCVGPILERLRTEAAWRVLVLPDHYTLCRTRKHDPTPPPFLVAGTGIEPDGSARFTEAEASRSGSVIGHGHELLERVLFSSHRA